MFERKRGERPRFSCAERGGTVADLQSELDKIIKRKFGRKRVLRSKVVGRFPKGVEREYAKVIKGYFTHFWKTYKKYKPLIDEAFERAGGVLTPAMATYLRQIFLNMYNDYGRRTARIKLENKVWALGKMGEKLSIAEWKREVKRTIGIDILDDYYKGEFYKTELQKWVADNVNLVTTRPRETLGEMMDIVQTGFVSGTNTLEIARRLQEKYNYTSYWAQFVARDQMAKLNCDVTRQAQLSAGVTRYEWSTSDDSRVRESHRVLDGKVFSWDEPPIVDDKTGRRCHPGQDYQCRCVALPVFDKDSLMFPAGYVDGKTRKMVRI